MIDDDFCPLPIPIQHFLSDGILVYKAQSEEGINYLILTILALFILLILKILIALLIKEKRRVCSNTSKKLRFENEDPEVKLLGELSRKV